MAERCVALLRGVNLGRAKRVPMAELRSLVEDLGFTDARTLLNSGNVVFTARPAAVRGAARKIHEAVAQRLGVSAAVMVLTGAELGKILDENPLAGVADNPSRMLIAVFADATARENAKPLAAQSWEPEMLALGSRAAYLWCPDGISAGRLFETFDRTLRDGVTARNQATMTKLLALL